jgi:hypothetical protein
VRQQHPEVFTEAIVHTRQGDRGLSLADSGGRDIEGERSRCHIDAAATPRLSTETCAPAPRISADKGLALPAAAARHAGCAGRRNCNVNLDDLDRDRPDLNCEPEGWRIGLSNVGISLFFFGVPPDLHIPFWSVTS